MLISWGACSRACALTDKLGLVKTYQGCLQGRYAEIHIIVAIGALQHQANILVIIVAC